MSPDAQEQPSLFSHRLLPLHGERTRTCLNVSRYIEEVESFVVNLGLISDVFVATTQNLVA